MNAFESMTALLVEPHQPVRRILRDILRVLGFAEVRAVDNPEDAIKLLEDEGMHVDVIFADWSGTCDAVTLLRLLRAEESPDPFVPVIVMSAHSDRDHVKMARDLGAHEYILKPFAPQTVTAHLNTMFKHPRLFVHSDAFFGPDRRRHRGLDFPGPERRSVTNYVDRRRRDAPFPGQDRRHRGRPVSQVTMP